MKNKTVLYSLLVGVLFLSFLGKNFFSKPDITYKDFDRLDGENTLFWNWKKFTDEDKEALLFYKNLYLHYFKEVKESNKWAKIPKTLHYIWLGPKEFPIESISYVNSWMQRHPKWTVKFWTDDPDRPLPHSGMEKHLISELSLSHLGSYVERTDNFGEKSDLLRYEILFQEGGIYVDHDIECFHCFDALASSVDFFAGLEPPHLNEGIDGRIFPCNAIFGAKPAHPVLAKTIDYVKKRWDKVDQVFPGTDAQSRTLKVIHRTFHSFSLGTRQGLNIEGNKDIVFPASFFYPDLIITGKAFERLKEKGFIWASHKCSGEWKPQDSSSLLKEELEIATSKNRLYKKQLKNTRILLYGNFAISGLCLYWFFQERQKKRKARGWKHL